MALLTDRQLASGVTVNDLIHIVITGDTSQNPAGSSYKATIQQVASALTGVTGTSGSSGSSGSSGVSGVGSFLPLSGGTVSGITTFNSGLSANTFSAVTIGSSSNCVTDLYVQNVHSCSPLNINPLNEGNVIVGTNGTLTVDLTNSRVGINTQTPGYALMVSGTTSRFWYDPTFFSGRVQISGDTGLPSYYATIGPYLTKPSAGYQFGVRAWDDTSFPGYGKVGDSFVYASNESNGLNFINGPGTGTEDYIRFYAGKNATSTPDVHIEGTGTTKGYVGFGTTTPAERVDVNGRIKTSSIQITSGATNGYVLTSDASGNATWGLPTTAFTSGLTASTIYTNYIDFNTGATVTQSPGRIYWDSGTGTLNVTVGDNTTGLIDLQVGQEEIVRVYNDESTTLQKGEIVYVSGSQGNRPKVKRALATSDGYSVTTLGMVDLAISAGSEGYVTTFGIISNLNTLGLTGGTAIWLSPTVAGAYTTTKPIAPQHTVLIGYVVRVSATVGSIFVNISNGWELDELHDVRISGASEGDLLVRSSYSGTPVWVNSKTLPGSYTITGNTTIQNGLTATTISATTYQNLPSDVIIIDSTQIQSGFTGGVLFQSSASTVSQTTGFTWDNVNKRLGIGTNTPLYDLDVYGSIYQKTGELLITSTSGVNKEGPFIASEGGTNRTIQLGISDNSTVPVGIDMFVTNNTFPPSYMNFRVNNADLVRMSGSSVIISGNTYTSGITATTISASTLNLAGSQIESAWISYTPVLTASVTNPVIGNGTVEGWYKLVGKTCFVRGNIVMGSTTTFGSGEWYVSVPVTAANADAILLNANILDNGTAWYNAFIAGSRAGFNTKAAIQYQNTGGTTDSLSPSTPFTWTTGDRFLWNGSYEIA